eukprot:TRINITY_DN3037_c0_g2_i1.p2 TRINITY_DN3037_c0_g2~~TRINITY_DN3037_c0_g2_i1.p2  ORF type:complete len:877 (-),score=257.73 TRINITY_DN3037_c0_g2_i1:2904-5465(-)
MATNADNVLELIDWSKTPEELAERWGNCRLPPNYPDSEDEAKEWLPDEDLAKNKKTKLHPNIPLPQPWEVMTTEEKDAYREEALERERIQSGNLPSDKEEELADEAIDKEIGELDLPSDVDIDTDFEEEIVEDKWIALTDSHMDTMEHAFSRFSTLGEIDMLEFIMREAGIHTQGVTDPEAIKKMLQYKFAHVIGVDYKTFMRFQDSGYNDPEIIERMLMHVRGELHTPVDSEDERLELERMEKFYADKKYRDRPLPEGLWLKEEVYASEQLFYGYLFMKYVVTSGAEERAKLVRDALEGAKKDDDLEAVLFKDESECPIDILADNTELMKEAAQKLGLDVDWFMKKLREPEGFFNLIEGTLFTEDGPEKLENLIEEYSELAPAQRKQLTYQLFHKSFSDLLDERIYQKSALKRRKALLKLGHEASKNEVLVHQPDPALEADKILQKSAKKEHLVDQQLNLEEDSDYDTDYDEFVLHDDEYFPDIIPVMDYQEDLICQERAVLQQHLMNTAPPVIARVEDPWFRDVLPQDSDGEWDTIPVGSDTDKDSGTSDTDDDFPEKWDKTLDHYFPVKPEEKWGPRELVRDRHQELVELTKTMERVQFSYDRDVLPQDSDGEWDTIPVGSDTDKDSGTSDTDDDFPEKWDKTLDHYFPVKPEEKWGPRELVRDRHQELVELTKTMERVQFSYGRQQNKVLTKETFVIHGLYAMKKYAQESGDDFTEKDVDDYRTMREKHWPLYNAGLPIPSYDPEERQECGLRYEEVSDVFIQHVKQMMKAMRRFTDEDLAELKTPLDERIFVLDEYVALVEGSPPKGKQVKYALDDSDPDDDVQFFFRDFFNVKYQQKAQKEFERLSR